MFSFHSSRRFRQWILGSLCALGVVCVAQAPTQAAIQRSADFSEGNSLGIGLYGIAYDYSLWNVSLGAYAMTKQYGSNLTPILDQSPELGLRFLARSYERDGLSVGWVGGLHVSSYKDYSGVTQDYRQRSTLTPDVGMSVAYGFDLFEMPLALRMNLTLGFSLLEGGDFFQRLKFGPQTGLELAWQPREDLEVTLGGGTLLGMRLKF